MLSFTIYAILVCVVINALIIGRALWVVYVIRPEYEDDVQDDFRASMERWGNMREED